MAIGTTTSIVLYNNPGILMNIALGIYYLPVFLHAYEATKSTFQCVKWLYCKLRKSS